MTEHQGIVTYVNDEEGDDNPGVIIDTQAWSGKALSAAEAHVLADELHGRANYFEEISRPWHPMTLGQIRGWLSGSFGVGDYGTAEPQAVITEVRETEHGVEYR